MKRAIEGFLIAIVLAAAPLTRARAAESGTQETSAIAEATKYFDRANKFVEAGSLPRAKLEYEKAIKLYPKYLDAYYNLAVVCEKLGEKGGAIDQYKRYLEIKPDDADVWNQVGVLYDETGSKKEGRNAYQKALAINPKYGRAHHNLGVLLKEEGDLKGAEQHLATFVKLEEEAGRPNGDAYYSLGILYLQELRDKDAKLLLQKAIDIDPSVPHFNNAMGDTYLLEKRPDESIVYYKKAIEKDPKYALAYSGLGDAYAQLKERDKALTAYRKALELRPDYALVYYKLGLFYEDNNPTEAIKNFEKYLQSGRTIEYRDEVAAKIEALKLTLKP
ncbi:MAG TPA: tetratricopeptide repeat protein [Verrucomicrobiae bacterium]|nr:tetratricopeptide repeat protein [Verrucomicrobiae bacterium]